MPRFSYDGQAIIDHDTGERLSTLDQCRDKLNDLNALVDLINDQEPYSNDFDPVVPYS